MRKLIVVALVGLGSMTMAVAKETGGGEGCTLAGAWTSFTANNTMGGLATFTGQSNSSGTLTAEFMDPFLITLGGEFSNAVRLPATGVWNRTGGNTFVVTFIGVALDSAGKVVWIGKITAHDTLSDGCNKLTADSTLEVFLPNQNPLVDEPVNTIRDEFVAFRISG